MRVFDKELLKILGCPRCKQKLILKTESLSCDSCSVQYPIVEGIPDFHVRNPLYEEQYHKDGGIGSGSAGKKKISPPANLVRQVIKKATPSCRSLSRRSREIIVSHLDHDPVHGSESVILNVGPGKTRDMKKLFKECGRVMKLCVSLDENADIVGDVRYLPFQTNTVDFLFIIAVLEHVDDPAKAVEDISKCLKPGGRVYAEIPFCRAYHAMPCDFQRYTISGIEKLFEDFRLLEKGVASGPASAMSLSISSFFAVSLSFNNMTRYKFWNRIFRIVTKPLQFLDRLYENNKLAHRFASTLYVMCEKKV